MKFILIIFVFLSCNLGDKKKLLILNYFMC
jgi:hypothetical protein